MKRLLVIVCVACLAMVMYGCSGGGSSSSSTPQPPDLTGTWKQANSANPDSYQQAVIEGDTITINWVSNNGDTQSLYWSGTFTAPETADTPYTWVSENDTSKTKTAMLASSDATKEFTYDKDQISYSASAMGTTTTVKLEKVD